MAIRRKRPILWGFLALIAILGSLFAFNRGFRETTILVAAIVWFDITKPNDPVTHNVRTKFRHGNHENGDKIALTPKPFTTGMPKAEVLKQLAAYKYKLDPEGSFPSKTAVDDIRPRNDIFFSLSSPEGVCDVTYEVEVSFDSGDRLTGAWGSIVDSGCL